ncbi:hypothetical protein BVC80_1555g11 [Macleaya cordata]|uniref:Uncharacterized protein n=1 Tax=Macleaya cordata TaxID=56857 RepID=A0A200QY27_MACCD|nr:hypothetical protein BVC80_1555g11 [Macleaya cordata]
MGGGGAMRAVGKVAGFSLIRGPTSFPLPAEQSVAGVARKASRPIPSILSSPLIEDGKSAVALASQNAGIHVGESVQRPCWELDDWEFAGDEEEEFLLDSIHHSMPRVVFGGVPTYEEAKEATSDLKEALEKIHVSSNATGSLDSSTAEESGESLHFSPGYSETKACVTSESVVVQPQTPKPVLQAFSLLKESPQAQNVVASLASDKNVWDAVMRNEKVMEFIKSQKTDMDVKESVLDTRNFSDNIDNFDDDKHEEDTENGFIEQLLQKVKNTVSNMISKIQGLVDNIFGIPAAREGAPIDKTIGASFMALAVLTIMVVMLKRA